jgi:cytochrome P450
MAQFIHYQSYVFRIYTTSNILTLSQATTYALLDLYSHPEYIEPLREEVEGPSFAEFARDSQGLPLLDSFLKESARLSAFESSKFSRIPPI